VPAGCEFSIRLAWEPDQAGRAGRNGGLDGQVLPGYAPVHLHEAMNRLQLAVAQVSPPPGCGAMSTPP
jgi:hypothetical protein